MVHALGFRAFLGAGFKTVRLGLIVVSQAPQGGTSGVEGGGGVGVGGVWGGGGGGKKDGRLLQLPLVLANRPLADPGFLGGVPI